MTNKLVCLMLLGCFGFFQTVCGQANNCSDVMCNCCLENATCQHNGYCGGQCKDGFHGGKCLNSCPINCLTCKDRNDPNNDPSFYGVANCTSCKPGYYSTPESFLCQLNCPDGCQTCTSDTDTGFNGDYCTLHLTSTKKGVPVAVAGSVIGSLVVIIALVGLIIFFKRRKYSSSSESKSTRTIAHTESQTPERVYANDAAITTASNECNTYEILTSTSITIPDYESLSVGAFLVQGETRSLTKKDMNGIASKMSQQPVAPLKDEHEYYNCEASLGQSVPYSDLASYFDKK